MPTPPTYTNAFAVIGSATEIPLISGGRPSWGYFRSPVTFYYGGTTDRYNNPSGTSSDYDVPGMTLASSTTGVNLFSSWQPFQLQALYNPSGDGGFTFGPYVFGAPDNFDFCSVSEDDFNAGVVGGTVTAFDTPSGSSVNFTITAESGNWNGVAQYPGAGDSVLAIVLP